MSLHTKAEAVVNNTHIDDHEKSCSHCVSKPRIRNSGVAAGIDPARLMLRLSAVVLDGPPEQPISNLRYMCGLIPFDFDTSAVAELPGRKAADVSAPPQASSLSNAKLTFIWVSRDAIFPPKASSVFLLLQLSSVLWPHSCARVRDASLYGHNAYFRVPSRLAFRFHECTIFHTLINASFKIGVQ